MQTLVIYPRDVNPSESRFRSEHNRASHTTRQVKGPDYILNERANLVSLVIHATRLYAKLRDGREVIATFDTFGNALAWSYRKALKSVPIVIHVDGKKLCTHGHSASHSAWRDRYAK